MVSSPIFSDVRRVHEYYTCNCGDKMLSITSFLLMGNVATKEAFDWISKEPLIERAASVINRLHDDIVGHEVRYTN